MEWKKDALLFHGGFGNTGNTGNTTSNTSNTGNTGNISNADEYTPRLKLNPNVLRVPIVPGCAPELAYGDLHGRGVRGIVLEAFGVGNMPMSVDDVSGWIPWLRGQRNKGMVIYLTSQCESGDVRVGAFPNPGTLFLVPCT